MDMIDGLGKEQPLEGYPRVDLQQADILQFPPLTLRRDPCERFTNSLPVEFDADIVAAGMRQGAADKKLTEAGTDLHFQEGATAELLMPGDRAPGLVIRDNRAEQE